MVEAYRAFGSYLLFKQILADPLGKLYRAGEFDRGGIRRTAWLRIFDTTRIPAEDIESGFERTEEIAAAVKSTNVASGVECLVDDGIPALAFDYVASQPLSRVFDLVVTEQFPIPVDNALLILEKISLALSAGLTASIGGARVVHGFVHPSLVFVTNDGEGLLSGFGLGEQLLGLVDSEEIAAEIHPYLAPEVLQSRTPSRQGDVYSLGAVLFHLLVGTPLPVRPEERRDALGSAQMAYEEEPVPEDIRALLSRCLADRPDDRYSSAADFKKELDRLLYGGAYSPTTFNLALFMDRLFRSEIEVEEHERSTEEATDVAPYLGPVKDPEPVPALDLNGDSEPVGFNKLWYGVGGIAIVATLAAALFWFSGRASTPGPPPTPTAAEVATQRQAQEEKMRELAQGLVAEMMAEKEAEIRGELTDSQNKIDDLQRRLQESEQRGEQGRLSADDERRRDDLQRQIAAEEEAQKIREAELEAERQKAEEDARLQATAQQTATAIAEEEASLAVAATPTPPPPTTVPTPAAESTVVAKIVETIETNTFFEPSEVDSLPVIVKKEVVVWPRQAMDTRAQGVVIMQVTVNADGLVDDAKVLRADHEGFGIPEAAIKAARKCRFKPALKDGVRVKSYATLTERYRFLLTRE